MTLSYYHPFTGASIMFNLKNRDHVQDPKEAPKPGLKPALYDPPQNTARPTPAVRVSPPSGLAREPLPATTFPPRDEAAHVLGPAPGSVEAAPRAVDPPGSKLFVGVNIKLKGVEISDCDVLVIEGHVEATIHSKVMQIAKPGTLKGTALIDVAEVHGEFVGELTARTRLIVHGTGRVSGTIRYGQLVVAEGGEISGDMKRMDPADNTNKQAHPPRAHAADPKYSVPSR
jgi:cytoskeletal protein CcmA (bactofilin family)